MRFANSCAPRTPVFRIFVPVPFSPLRGYFPNPRRHAGANLTINMRCHQLGFQDCRMRLLRSSSPRRSNVDLSQLASE